MRVVHLAAVDAEGGAARSAFRLHQGLLAAGQDSTMLVGRKVSGENSVHAAPAPDAVSAFFWNLIEKSYLEPRRTSVSNTFFSIGYPGVELNQHPLVRAADVLHIHWVADFLSPASLARLATLGKPLVWTLHDQRPFTGGCHFSAGCTGYQKDCGHCPQLENDAHDVPAANLADQLRLVPAGAITVVTPSRWLADCARRSALFARSRIEIIPYGIETDRFLPQPRAEARRQLEWPVEGFHVLFGADYGNEKRKGFQELATALRLCWNDPDFQQWVRRGDVRLAAFGRPSPELAALPIPIQYCGYVSSEAALARMYAAANLFLLPSLEDNLPNTALEAMSCGTPVLAFNVGGVPDLVADGFTGRLASAGDSAMLSACLRSLIASPDECESWGANCRRRITEGFSLNSQTRRYSSLYESLGAARSPCSEISTDCETGARLQSLYPRLLLASLEHFTGTMNRATTAQRKVGRELMQMLREECAKPAVGSDPLREQNLADLKSEFMAAEILRQARLTERRQGKLARRERLAGLLRTLGVRK
jgi:glycosyltransferase involved in cell wall biosynthesis